MTCSHCELSIQCVEPVCKALSTECDMQPLSTDAHEAFFGLFRTNCFILHPNQVDSGVTPKSAKRHTEKHQKRALLEQPTCLMRLPIGRGVVKSKGVLFTGISAPVGT